MQLTRQSWFVLAVSIFYALCTAGVLASGLVDAIDKGISLGTVAYALLLVVCAGFCWFVAVCIRRRQPAKKSNLIAMTGFTVLYSIDVVISDLAMSLLIFPACMFVFLVVVPSQQKWLARGEK